MQAIAPVTPAQLLAVGQEPLMKVEIYVAAAWVNLTALAGNNYIEDASVSLGGASMTPDPVEGNWTATLFNEDGIFHPQHPTSAYKDYCKTERLTKISIGARYGGVDRYWAQVIGYMDIPNFSAPDYKVAISGGDYMKRLRETELRRPNNYWGSSATFNSISSDGVWGAEIYAEVDAMDTADDGTAPYDNVANWVPLNCNFVSFPDAGGGSTFVGRVTGQGPRPVGISNLNVGAAVAGKYYQLKFKHRIVGGTGLIGIRLRIDQASGRLLHEIYFPTDAWKEETVEFIALDTGPIIWRFHLAPVACDLRLDQFSIKNYSPYWTRYYALPAASKGPYYVTLDSGAGAVPVWQGEGDEDWKYVADAEAGPDPPFHPAKIVFFNINKTVPNGVNNLVIYYFTTTAAEDVVARLLYLAGVNDPATNAPYANEAAAKAAIVGAPEYVDPAVDIDMVWFKAGTSCLDAIKMVCERCNYRFYFKYDGTPVFRPKPTPGAAVFTFTSPGHIGSITTYQAIEEVKNRIVIKGLKVSDTPGKEETMPSDLSGEDSDAASIAAYGERTWTINNHLFQTQAAIDAMCTALLAEYKDPKWCSDLEIPFNPVPLELGDNIQWEERLSPILDITQTGIIRDIKIDNYTATYKCVHT